MLNRASLLAGLTILALNAHAQQEASSRQATAELQLSNDTLQLRYVGSGKEVAAGGGKLTGAFFLSEQRDIVLSAGMLFPADLNIDRLTISFGPQLYAALLEEENQDVMAVSIGAEARYLLIESMGLVVAGQAYYAPDILTFGSAD